MGNKKINIKHGRKFECHVLKSVEEGSKRKRNWKEKKNGKKSNETDQK